MAKICCLIAKTPILYAIQSDDLPPASESTKPDNDESSDDTRNAEYLQDIDVEVLPPEESPPPL